MVVCVLKVCLEVKFIEDFEYSTGQRSNYEWNDKVTGHKSATLEEDAQSRPLLTATCTSQGQGCDKQTGKY